MSRMTTTVYECDWCKKREPPKPHSCDEDPPEGWKTIEYSELCIECQAARKQALADVAHFCLNKRPWTPVDLPRQGTDK